MDLSQLIPPIPVLNNFQSLLINQGNQNNSDMTPPPSNAINRQTSPPSASNHEDPYTCDICHKSFAVPARLTRHYRTHTGEKPYTCEYCSKSFSVKENLSVHRRIHTKERPYICTVCSRAFEHSGKLHRHMRIHTGERPHKCNICNKTFIQSGQLVIHMRTHTGEKPYVCKTCGKGFTCSKQLKVHTRTHTGEKPYACEICGKSFGYNHVLKLHQVAHFGEKVYKCTLCSTTFNSKKALENHIKTHNNTGSGDSHANHENLDFQSNKGKQMMSKSAPVSLPQNQVSSDKENLHSSSSSTSSDDDILIPLHSGVPKARSMSITSSPTSSSRSMTPEDPEEADRLIMDLSDEDDTRQHSNQKGQQRSNYYPPIFQNLPKHISVHEEPNSAMTYLYVTTEEQRSVGQYAPSQSHRTSNPPNSSTPFNLSSSVRIREDVVKELEKYGYGIGQSYHGQNGQYHKVHSDDEGSSNDPLAPMRKLLNNRSGLEIRPIQTNSRSSTDQDSMFPNSYSRDSYSSLSMATVNSNTTTTTPYKVLELALKKGSKAVQLELSNNKRANLFKEDPLPTTSPRKRSRMILEKYLHDEEKGVGKEVGEVISCNRGNSPTVRYSSVIQFANKK